ncbi:MAG: threonyl-tRNA synthetase editing domain-containing protein [Candidatus Altiarchaeota archaeon]
MKLLMFDSPEFWYRTHSKTLESVEAVDKEHRIDNAVVVFLQSEKEDEGRRDSVLKDAVGNISWLARKVGRSRVVLHSFAHLSDSKSSIGFAGEIIEALKAKLTEKGFEADTTPFGYFLEFKIHVGGQSLAKVWKNI